jgi:signal transduction histidine kinase
MNAPETLDLTLEGLIHDLNNVFQTIAESADMIETDPKWARLAATLHRSADRGQRLAHSILETKRATTDLASVVETAVQFSRDYLECVHGPRVEFRQSIDYELRLAGDSATWERVLVNLFLNAAEAGASTVEIAAGHNEILISDNGPGIPPELLPHIFQPHVSTKPIMSGLGLYVVQSLVEKHGGTVTAANRPGGGAEFTIRLTT